MDSVEQLNGTYFYKGVSNISAGELFFWIFIDEVNEQLGGIKDVIAMATIILGMPLIPVEGKPLSATKGTSIASLSMRTLIKTRLPGRGWATITNAAITHRRLTYTKNLGAFVGRWTPFIGYAITAYDLSVIPFKAVKKYNSIVRDEHKIW